MMRKNKAFLQSMIQIALPVTLQSLLQSSFSVVDQIMIGRLGSVSIAAVGLGGKFASLYSVLLGAVTAAAGIMISQYIGQKAEREVRRSFLVNLLLAVGLALVFLWLSACFPGKIMGVYTKDKETVGQAARYLSIYAVSYLPMAVSMITAALLRCLGAAALPLYGSMASVVVNTGMNYLLIFGKGGLPQLGIEGAALATAISQWISAILMVLFLIWWCQRAGIRRAVPWQKRTESKNSWRSRQFDYRRAGQYLGILCPIILCEFFWSLGENVYTAIYGNIGTDACAAMTLTVPVQTLLMGALSGLSQAAGILIGKSLGSGSGEKAYEESKLLMVYGFIASLCLSVVLLLTKNFYVQIYQVEPAVRAATGHILTAFAIISPVKVQNMILGGGIIRSGGKTKYILMVDFVGTWFFGVPLGLLAAFVWQL